MLSNSLLSAVLALPALAAAVVVAPRAAATPIPWVSVDSEGDATTITATAPPSSLTSTAAHVLSINGHKTTTTGAPPAVTATGPGLAGAFLACNNAHGSVVSPFCQPQTGSELSPGQTYYVTWDPAYFTTSEQTVEVEGQYPSGDGFSTSVIPASAGFYTWTIPSTFLADNHAGTAANVTLYLLYNETVGEVVTTLRVAGPSVIVTSSPDTIQHHHRVSPVAIAVPVVVAVAVLALFCFCVWSFRHHGHLPCIGGFVSKRTSSFSAQGYGVRPSHGSRTANFAVAHAFGGSSNKPYPTVSTQPADEGSRSPSSPGRSANVFREELKRQEEERR